MCKRESQLTDSQTNASILSFAEVDGFMETAPKPSDILIRMVNEITGDEEGVNVKAALCVGFAAFLRSGEFTWDTWSSESHHSRLSRGHVAFHSASVTLTLPASKTDQFHVGTDIHL